MIQVIFLQCDKHKEHTAFYLLCAHIGLFCFGQIQLNLVKTYQLDLLQQHPISDTEMGGEIAVI